ncbi:MAG: hypothetical protein ACLUHF_06680 [Faecalitalea cylindroides]
MPAKSVATKQADAVMENQLEIPSFGQKKEQPEVNVQVVFEKSGIDKDERDDLKMMYLFGIMITILNFVILAKQVW